MRTTRKRDCRRRNFLVNFKDIFGENNFVIAPERYDAYYCQGRCPNSIYDGLNATFHAVIQTTQNSIDSSLVPAACCVPTTLKSLRLLYFDRNGHAKLVTINNMIVDGCGCH